MTRGIETKVTIKLRPGKNQVDSDYFFEILFARKGQVDGRLEEKYLLAQKAKSIFHRCCQPGGLNNSSMTKIIGEEEITQGEWNTIIRKMRDIGLIRRDGNILRPSKQLLEHLQDMSTALYKYYLDQGVNVR